MENYFFIVIALIVIILLARYFFNKPKSSSPSDSMDNVASLFFLLDNVKMNKNKGEKLYPIAMALGTRDKSFFFNFGNAQIDEDEIEKMILADSAEIQAVCIISDIPALSKLKIVNAVKGDSLAELSYMPYVHEDGEYKFLAKDIEIVDPVKNIL